MQINIQTVHYYNNLCENNNIDNIIKCPFDKDDVVVTRIDQSDEPEFYCVYHKSVFRLNDVAKDEIKKTVLKYINQ